jgi:hypothetical protein
MSHPEIKSYDQLGDSTEIDVREDVAYRVDFHLTEDPSSLLIQVMPKTEDEIPFALKVDREKANDAFLHPFSYLAIGGLAATVQEKKPTRWDRALDAYNALPSKTQRERAMESLRKVAGDTPAVPTLLFDAVRVQAEAAQTTDTASALTA